MSLSLSSAKELIIGTHVKVFQYLSFFRFSLFLLSFSVLVPNIQYMYGILDSVDRLVLPPVNRNAVDINAGYDRYEYLMLMLNSMIFYIF